MAPKTRRVPDVKLFFFIIDTGGGGGGGGGGGTYVMKDLKLY